MKLYIIQYEKVTINANVSMDEDEIMTHRLWEVIVWLFQRAKDENRPPEDCVNDISEAFSLINAIASDPESSPGDRATANALREEMSRLARLHTDDLKEAVETMAADKSAPAEIREDSRVSLAQLEQQLTERGPDPTRWLQ
jgi:hypothetical protein